MALPVYKSLLRHVLLPLYTGLIQKDGFSAYLREYESNQKLTADRIAALQLEKLNRLLAHSWSTVPYLKQRWTAAGLNADPLRSLDELNRYPLQTKEEITANYDSMISSLWRGKSINKTTSGSTGVPFRLEYTRESDARRRAVMWRGYGWSGAELGGRCVYLWGADRNLAAFRQFKIDLYHRVYNRRMLNCFEMTRGNLAEYASAMRRADPEYVVAYVNPIVALARWAVEHGVSLGRPRAVLTGAEALSMVQRQVIEAAFNAPVFNTYGCREVMLIAAECRQHRLHYNADHLVVESVGQDGADTVGNPGRAAVTDLHNYAMPLIRYVNGDLIIKSERRCACGLPLPLLDRVEGRILDAIRTADGRMLPGEFFPHLMKDFTTILEFQVVQRRLDAIDFNLVPREVISPDELQQIRAAVESALGPTVAVGFHVVDAIPRTSSGKFRVTMSLLDGQQR